MDTLKPYIRTFSEDEYLPKEPDIKYKRNFFIISGCSGSGKSVLMQEISNRGFKVIHEPGRQVVKEQIHINGDALPWEGKDWKKFVELTISRTIYQYNSMAGENGIVYFDRSIIDQISWDHLNVTVPGHLVNAALKYRFNKNVFICPPWKEIYKIDNERKHSYEDALVSYNSLIKNYENFGSKITILPKTSVNERADFVIVACHREIESKE